MKVKQVLFILALLPLCNCASDSTVYRGTHPSPFYYPPTKDEVFIWPEWDRRSHREPWEHHQF